MKKTSFAIKIALGLIVFGLFFFAIGALSGDNFSILKDEIGYRVYDDDNRITDISVLENFENINISADLDKIEIIKSSESKIELDYSDKAEVIEYKLENNTLYISQVSTSSEDVSLNLNNKCIDSLKLYLKNDTKINNILINQDYGDIIISGLDCLSAEINSNYGHINLSNLIAKEITIMMEDGHIISSKLDIKDTYNLQNKYGNIDLDNSDFSNLIVYMEDGNLDISNVNTYYSEFKNEYGNTYTEGFITNGLLVNAHDSDIDLRGKFLGDSTVNNKYGNINIISSDNENLFDYSIVNKHGNIDINNEIYEGSITKNNNTNNNLSVNCEDGNVKIYFKSN